MGRIARLLSFSRSQRGSSMVSDVKCDPGGEPLVTVEHFSDIGDDSYPLRMDYVALSDDRGTGREMSIGYLDPLNEQLSEPGDKRIYARNATSGVEAVSLWLKNDHTAVLSNPNGSATLASDGSVTISNNSSVFRVLSSGTISGNNDGGSFTLGDDGVFVVNGVRILTDGTIIAPGNVSGVSLSASTSLTVGGVEMSNHTHESADPPADTGPAK